MFTHTQFLYEFQDHNSQNMTSLKIHEPSDRRLFKIWLLSAMEKKSMLPEKLYIINNTEIQIRVF
jgi:hypothetical protein